jgi:predicted nuclease of predicted toxin-antitoxin system
VKPFEFPLLTDENIGPDVVAGLRERGCDVRTVGEEDLIGSVDRDVLDCAVRQGRVVVTHDLAFGHAIIAAGAPFVGIVYLRPGHISASFVLAVVDAVIQSSVDIATVRAGCRTPRGHGPRSGANESAVVK